MLIKIPILIVTENFPNSAEPYRGIYILEQLREIAKEYDLHVLVPLNIASRSFITFLSQKSERVIDGIHVYYLKYPYLPVERLMPVLDTINRKLYRRFLFSRLLGKAKKLMKRRPFTLIHGQEVFVGDLAIPLGEKLCIKKLFTIHSMREENIRYFGCEIMDGVIDNLKRADHLIAVSNLARDAYKGLLDVTKINVVYNGFNTKKMTCTESPRQATVSLLSVCNLVELKKIDLVLSVLRDIKHEEEVAFSYRIVGGGDKKYYQNLINKFGLQENVELVGTVRPEQIGSYYGECDIFVLPSVRESFGIVYLEAMYCEKPVICSSQSGIAEIIENGRHGFIVQPDDPADLKQKLLTLIRDQKLRLRMGGAGKELSGNFTIEKQAKKILSAYRSAIEA